MLKLALSFWVKLSEIVRFIGFNSCILLWFNAILHFFTNWSKEISKLLSNMLQGVYFYHQLLMSIIYLITYSFQSKLCCLSPATKVLNYFIYMQRSFYLKIAYLFKADLLFCFHISHAFQTYLLCLVFDFIICLCILSLTLI